MMSNKATSITLFSFRTPAMKTFHTTWFAFFLCFWGWYGIAPLSPIVMKQLGFDKVQMLNSVIASVAITIIARIIVGKLAERFGPRKTYTALLTIGALPVMAIGLCDNYTSFVICRLIIGTVGASFVITQYHTSLFFAPNCVGTANATTAGWGNLGATFAFLVMMPLSAFMVHMFGEENGWRIAMVVPGVAMFLFGLFYYRNTLDTPEGNFDAIKKEVNNKTKNIKDNSAATGVFTDKRVWILFIMYAVTFGIELTFMNVASLYFSDVYGMSAQNAMWFGVLFGCMNIFARTMGGRKTDIAGQKNGINGRVKYMGYVVVAQGVAMMIFSQLQSIYMVIPILIIFSITTKMAQGATYAVVPFINKKAMGRVAGIVGAGGNVGAVLAGFLLRQESVSYQNGFLILGIIVLCSAILAFIVNFKIGDKTQAERQQVIDNSKAVA